MEKTELGMQWQTLGELAKGYAALPRKKFEAQFLAPFLLEVDSEAGTLESESGVTRAYDPDLAKQEFAPTLTKSRILNFGDGEQFLVGRKSGHAIQALHETISDTHCVFERIGSMWSIRDVDSKNGTYVTGQKLAPNEQLPLKFGSKVMLGEKQFLFLGPDDCFDLLQDLSKEPRIRPRSLGKYRTEFKNAGSPDEIRAEFPGPFLVVQAPKGREASASGPVSSNTITLSAEELKKGVNKNVADAIFNLSNHTLVRVGRATVTQIHLPLGAISNLHAAFVRDGDQWFVQDLGAKNGTFVWGDRVEGRKELESGSEVTLGNIKSIFFNVEDLITYATHRDSLV